ncbi:PaaI family thioesterase [Plantactinospora sp. CA-290183]|uniref:PaaI family thioesterase n=1 Tax=Plantactinospora sp. CA-290183 TaxID=3240006 RepID=UPI003D8CFF73
MIVPARFNGPPSSGNGGYSAGLFAGHADREVTLRRPPPLDTPLSMIDGQVRTADGAVVAEVRPPGEVDTPVPPIPYADALRAATTYAGFADHPFPTCYVCGPDRPDGLRIFPGRLPDDSTAAPWTVPDDVSAPTVWAALDCPGGWAVIAAGRPYVLGRITVRLGRLPTPGDRCVLRGALVAAEGRKALVHTTLYGPDGAELARARATWIGIAG